MEEDIKYICRFCGRECKNGNSLRNHERLCKENPNKQEMYWLEYGGFSKYNEKIKNGEVKRKPSNQYIKSEELGLPKPIISDETRKKKLVMVGEEKNIHRNSYRNYRKLCQKLQKKIQIIHLV